MAGKVAAAGRPSIIGGRIAAARGAAVAPMLARPGPEAAAEVLGEVTGIAVAHAAHDFGDAGRCALEEHSRPIEAEVPQITERRHADVGLEEMREA
jgi:hypothetical protein